MLVCFSQKSFVQRDIKKDHTKFSSNTKTKLQQEVLSPVPLGCHLKEQQLPQEKQHMQKDETCFCPFSAPFVKCPQLTNIPASCLHLFPALCRCIPIPVLHHPRAPLSPCILIAAETRIPTYPLRTDTQKPTSPMQHPLQFLGHPASFLTNSFARALPPEQEVLPLFIES